MKRNQQKRELSQLNREDLKAKVETMRKELFGLRINKTTSQIKDNSQFKKLRKDIARALTYLRQNDNTVNV